MSDLIEHAEATFEEARRWLSTHDSRSEAWQIMNRMYDTHFALDGVQSAELGTVTTQHAVRWESGEIVGPIGPNEARDLVADQNPGNPMTHLVREQILTEWRPADV